ncbi:MAG: hypothetical protein ACI4UV_07440 [Victivallales bacterium]
MQEVQGKSIKAELSFFILFSAFSANHSATTEKKSKKVIPQSIHSIDIISKQTILRWNKFHKKGLTHDFNG